MPDLLMPILLGLIIGAAIGATVLLTNFCALGAVADIVFAKDWRRMRAWLLAGGIAIIGAQILDNAHLIDLGSSIYAAPFLPLVPIILGGVCFGFGMALAGGCPSRALSRLGAGSLKSLVTLLVVGVVAAMTGLGVLVGLTDFLFNIGTVRVPPSNSLPVVLTTLIGGERYMRWIVTAIIGGGLLIFALKDSWFRASRGHLIGGGIIGLCVIAAWAGGSFGVNLVAPMGAAITGLTTQDVPTPFPASVIVGIPLGAFIAGALTRNLALESFTDAADLPRHLIGGALMGFGGTLALGCTFGQGLSGFSTLGIGSFLAIAAMWFGCLWGIRYFEAGSVMGGLVLALKRRMH